MYIGTIVPFYIVLLHIVHNVQMPCILGSCVSLVVVAGLMVLLHLPATDTFFGICFPTSACSAVVRSSYLKDCLSNFSWPKSGMAETVP